MPSAASEQTSATVVGFDGFFGLGGVQQSKLRMQSSHGMDPKRNNNMGRCGIFLPVASFHACQAPRQSRQVPLMLALRTCLVLVERIRASLGCGHHHGRIGKDDVYKAHCGLRCCIAQCLALNVFKWPLMTRNLAFPNPN